MTALMRPTWKITVEMRMAICALPMFRQPGAAPHSLILDAILAKVRNFRLSTRMKCAATGKTATVSMETR